MKEEIQKQNQTISEGENKAAHSTQQVHTRLDILMRANQEN